MSITKSELKKNISQVRARINRAALGCGRDPAEVKLLLATKTQETDVVRGALELGESIIGENRVQEALTRVPLFDEFTFEYHFIGRLQTNKVKDVLKFATCIQSVDRLELAEKLNTRLVRENKKIDILVQVNTSDEASKGGALPTEAIGLIKAAGTLPALRIKGLMTIGLYSGSREAVCGCFRRLRQVQKKARDLGLTGASFDVLSMGMSSDLEWAIAEGSTMVRVGSQVFGER